MTIPGVGQLTALAFVATIDGPDRFRTSRDVGPYLGLVPGRWKSGEIDYTGSISKCGDRRVRPLLYEAANVMLIRCGGDHAIEHAENEAGERRPIQSGSGRQYPDANWGPALQAL
jgi:transposase